MTAWPTIFALSMAACIAVLAALAIKMHRDCRAEMDGLAETALEGDKIAYALSGIFALDTLCELCPELFETHPVGCPLVGCAWPGALDTIGYAIMHLNDDHQWPREKIADWLDTLDVPLILNPPASSGD